MQAPEHHYNEVKRHLDRGDTFELRLFANKEPKFQRKIEFAKGTGDALKWSVDGKDQGNFEASNRLGPEIGQMQKAGLLAMGAKSKPHPQNISMWVNGENCGLCSGDKRKGTEVYKFPQARAFWLPLAATGAGAGNNERLLSGGGKLPVKRVAGAKKAGGVKTKRPAKKPTTVAKRVSSLKRAAANQVSSYAEDSDEDDDDDDDEEEEG